MGGMRPTDELHSLRSTQKAREQARKIRQITKGTRVKETKEKDMETKEDITSNEALNGLLSRIDQALEALDEARVWRRVERPRALATQTEYNQAHARKEAQLKTAISGQEHIDPYGPAGKARVEKFEKEHPKGKKHGLTPQEIVHPKLTADEWHEKLGQAGAKLHPLDKKPSKKGHSAQYILPHKDSKGRPVWKATLHHQGKHAHLEITHRSSWFEGPGAEKALTGIDKAEQKYNKRKETQSARPSGSDKVTEKPKALASKEVKAARSEED